jgi:hypothetical protein
MIHVNDIEEHLARGDIRSLETDFRALVSFPKEEEIEGVDNTAALSALLMKVAAALVGDQSIMPEGSVVAIMDAIAGWFTLADRTYASGALAVLQYPEQWDLAFVNAFEGLTSVQKGSS